MNRGAQNRNRGRRFVCRDLVSPGFHSVKECLHKRLLHRTTPVWEYDGLTPMAFIEYRPPERKCSTIPFSCQTALSGITAPLVNPWSWAYIALARRNRIKVPTQLVRSANRRSRSRWSRTKNTPTPKAATHTMATTGLQERTVKGANVAAQ